MRPAPRPLQRSSDGLTGPACCRGDRRGGGRLGSQAAPTTCSRHPRRARHRSSAPPARCRQQPISPGSRRRVLGKAQWLARARARAAPRSVRVSVAASRGTRRRGRSTASMPPAAAPRLVVARIPAPVPVAIPGEPRSLPAAGCPSRHCARLDAESAALARTPVLGRSSARVVRDPHVVDSAALAAQRVAAHNPSSGGMATAALRWPVGP